MRILTPEELKDIDSVGHGKTIAGVLDDDGDTHSIWASEACLPVIRVGHSDDDKTEAYRITVRDALILVDSANLNTTANELRTKLEEALTDAEFWKKKHAEDNEGLFFQINRNLGFAQEAAYRCGATEPRPTIRSIQIVEEKVAELTAQLAAARQTIAQLRQADTVRPVAGDAETECDCIHCR